MAQEPLPRIRLLMGPGTLPSQGMSMTLPPSRMTTIGLLRDATCVMSVRWKTRRPGCLPLHTTLPSIL